MQRKIEDHKDHEQLRGCFYRGRVRTDDRSAVAVSLCDGMVSENQSFFSISIIQSRFSTFTVVHLRISRKKTRVSSFSRVVNVKIFNYADL